MKTKLKIFLPISLVLVALFTSCETLIEVGKPRTKLARGAVFEDDLTAVSAVSGLYSGLTNQVGNFQSMTYVASLSSDELNVEQGDVQLQFSENSILSNNTSVGAIWQGAFNAIYQANAIIEGLENSDKISVTLKSQLTGEAKFFRAFYHFYLVNLFGEIPYITTTDYNVNGLISRMSVSLVYENVITDLLDAKALLSDDYSYSQGERVRVNKWAAASLLARAYLHTEEWVRAEEQATTVINKTSLFSLLDSGNLRKVFLKNSREMIWQLIPPSPQKYTSEGGLYNRPGHSPDQATLSEGLTHAFETGDDRKAEWVGIGNDGAHTWYYPLKYRETIDTGTGAEYSAVFRLAEQYLIRAEARAQQNKLIGPNSAESDINIIRTRAGLPPTMEVTQQNLLIAIQQERRVELFTEWGHRWLDLKRTGQATSVLSVIKANWDETDVLYPIPYSELQLNPNMIQNSGY